MAEMAMHGTYNAALVTLSIAVAILASFTALNLSGRLLAAAGAAQLFWWLLAASLALGGGIWTMHFVGMLAFQMPMPSTYDVQLTLLSLVLPILVTGVGLLTVSRFGTSATPLLAAGLLAGLGVVTMHYTGMAAMHIPGITVIYDPWLVLASIFIAIVAATAAFWLAFRMKGLWERLLASVVMGAAISGMHYTAMAAAAFRVNAHHSTSLRPEIEPGLLGVALAGAFSFLLLIGLLTAFFDRKLATLTAQEAMTLQQSEERLRALHSNSSDIVTILSEAGEITYEASSAKRILGHDTKDMVGRPLADFVPAEQRPELREFIALLLATPGASTTVELPARHADGTARAFEMTGRNLLHDPSIGGLVVNMRDISERRRLIAELERLSETDQLTGTLNRRGFLKLAEREFQRARRSGLPLTFVMVDIDHFKGVNDTYGHAAGDMVLAKVAEQCREHLRTIDVVARFGGEEFIILLTDMPLEAAHGVMERLLAAIAVCRVTTIKGDVSVTASFGLSVIDANKIDLETGIRLADEALYEAKNAGRNCIKVRQAS